MLGRTSYLEPGARKSFPEMVLQLIGHLVGTAVIFVAFYTLIWLASCFLDWLQGIHPFPAEVLPMIHKFEVWSIYLDEALCGVLLVAAAAKFCLELIGER